MDVDKGGKLGVDNRNKLDVGNGIKLLGVDNCDPLSVVASAAEGDLGRNQKQDEPKKKCGRPPKRQRKQLPKKGPPTQQKRCGRPSKSVTKQANIKGHFEDKPAKM